MGFLNRFREIPHSNTEIDHIVEHLEYLLSTHRGNGGTLHEFGIGQPNPHADSVGAARQFLFEILSDVMKYEKRIEQPQLQTLRDDADHCRRVLLTGYVEKRKVRFLLRYNQILGGVSVDEVVLD